jgi:hypothetical protein
MKSFFNTIQKGRNKSSSSSSSSSSQLSSPSSVELTNSSSVVDNSHAHDSHHISNSSSTIYSSTSTTKLDNNNISAFLDILEQIIKLKCRNPNLIITINLEELMSDIGGKNKGSGGGAAAGTSPEIMNIVNHFRSGTINKFFLENQNINSLWSSIIKILQTSDPILSANSCISLSSMNHMTMRNSPPPPTSSVGGLSTSGSSSSLTSYDHSNSNYPIANHLPSYHQRLLGALFSASDMLIRLDSSCATTIADSVSHVLLWNSVPGSSENHAGFCSLIHNSAETFPYYYTFADRVGLLVHPIDSNEWMAILTEGNSGVIVGYSAALNPNYTHSPNKGGGVGRRNRGGDMVEGESKEGGSGRVGEEKERGRNSSSRYDEYDEKPSSSSSFSSSSLVPRGGGGAGAGIGGREGRNASSRYRNEGDLSLNLSSPSIIAGDSSMMMLSSDKRANTPNLGSSSLDSSPSSRSKSSEDHGISVGGREENKPEGRAASPGMKQFPSLPPSQQEVLNTSLARNPKGIAMNSSSMDNLSFQASNNRTRTEGKDKHGDDEDDDWDNSLDEIPSMEKETDNNRNNKPMDSGKGAGSNRNSRNASPSVTQQTQQQPSEPSPSLLVKLKDLQNIFSSSLISAASLEYRSYRNIDYNEDYADSK